MAEKIFSASWDDYELIDAGGGKKLERWGSVITIRPEVQAYFKSAYPFEEWYKQAHWEYTEDRNQRGKWKALKKANDTWTIKYRSLSFQLQLSSNKHIGLFPEQRVNWDFTYERLKTNERFLNLFAFTGAISCVARSLGAETYHVDASKTILSKAARNMELSRLLNIRWVHDDALKFAQRQVKKGEKFDFIVMDPPAWGSGPNNEKWKLEDKLDELVSTAKLLLTDSGKLILNTYSPKVDTSLLEELQELYFDKGSTTVSELWMRSRSGKEMYFGNLLRSI